MPSKLVGRKAELALVLAQFERAAGFKGSTVLVRGDGGIGKSRLAAEVSKCVTAMGATLLSGHATPFDRGMPYGLLGEIISTVPLDAAGEVIDRVTELRALLSFGLDAPDTAGSSRQLRDVLSAATGLIVSLAETSPVVIVWEDLHDADADSALLFMRVARQLSTSRVLLLGSLRPQQRAETRQIERFVEQLALEGRGEVIDLDGLDASEVRELVAGFIRAEPDEALVDLVCTTSRGNPFFATETTRALVASDSIVIDGTKGRLVERSRLLHLNTALMHRFFQIGGVESRVARVLSAFGRVSLRHLPLVAAIAQVSVDRVAASFDLLVSDHLLVRRGEGNWEFAHSVLREALYDDVGPAEQRRIHAQIASHLTSEQGAGIAVDITELATHVAESADPGDETAAGVLAEAGNATASRAPLVSSQWFEKAAGLLPLNSPRRTELVARQAAAMFRASRPDASARLGREALQHIDDGAWRTRTLADTVNSLYICGELEAAVDVIDQEERRAGRIDVPLEAQRANFHAHLGRDAGREVNYASRSRDASAAELAITMSHDLHRAHVSGDGSTAALLVDALDRLCVTAPPHTRFAVHGTVALVAVQMGDTVSAQHALDAAMQLRGENRGFSIGGQLETAAVQLAFLQGRWNDALDLIPDVNWNMNQNHAFINAGWMTLTDWEIHLERGDLRRADEIAAQFDWKVEAVRRAMEAALGRLALAHGDVRGARRLLDEAKQRILATGFEGRSDPIVEALVAVCHAAGDHSAAIEHLATLDELADQTGWPLHRIHAQLSRATVVDDVASAHAALATAKHYGLAVHHARASLHLGRLGVAPQVNLTSAYHGFDKVGAMPWRQHVAAMMRSVGMVVPRVRADPGADLTDIESTLARLVSDGMTNRDIAAVMHYSSKTVEVYLTRLYAKTKCRTRLDLARAVAQGDVILSSS